MTALDHDAPALTADGHQGEAARQSAAFALADARERHGGLRRAEASARLDLAAATLAMDAAGEAARTSAAAGGRRTHDLCEQAAVEVATTAYAQALADLLRGEAPAGERARR